MTAPFVPVRIAAAPKPTMEKITIPDPRADPIYQRQMSELARSKADFNASQGLAKSQYNNTLNTSMRDMGWNQQGKRFDPSYRQGAYGQAYEGNTNDFAGRGLLHSGMFAQSQGDLNTDFNNRRASMLTTANDWSNTQRQQAVNFGNEQRVNEQSALADAIAAIAAKYSVNNSQIIPGKKTTISREKA